MDEQELQERFREPTGWRWGAMENGRGQTLRYGSSVPAEKPSAHILYVEGASECVEKTFELSRDFNRASCAFWALDRAGLGMSERFLSNRFKQHSEGFGYDSADIIKFAKKVIPDDDAPIVLLGHSTGGLIALMAAHDAPDVFSGVSVTAPLLGLKRPPIIRDREHIFAKLPLPSFMRKWFIPGGQEWMPRNERRGEMCNEDYSGDPQRAPIHDNWPQHNERLRVGAVTIGWVIEASKAMVQARDPAWLNEIDLPVRIFIAEKDKLINNSYTIEAVPHFKNATRTDFSDGRHDLLMERDSIRDVIIADTVALAKNAVRPR